MLSGTRGVLGEALDHAPTDLRVVSRVPGGSFVAEGVARDFRGHGWPTPRLPDLDYRATA
jgi:hypothetical protein